MERASRIHDIKLRIREGGNSLFFFKKYKKIFGEFIQSSYISVVIETRTIKNCKMNKKSNKAPKPTKMYNLEWWVDGKMREYAIDNGSPVINKTYPICNHLKQKLAGNYTHGLLMIKAVETK